MPTRGSRLAAYVRLPTEPACWSWMSPPLRDAQDEVGWQLRMQEGMATDDTVDRETLEMCLVGRMDVSRFYEFHTAARATPGENPLVRCAVCGLHKEWAGIAEDHDHRAGLVRGYLCRGCNAIEGKRVRRGVFDAYRERHPALILGYRHYYVGRGWPRLWWQNLGLARSLTGDPEWQPLESVGW